MLPPSPLVKKCMPSVRSSTSIAHTTVRAGKAKVIRKLEHKAVHVNSGMRMNVMAGARCVKMVTMKLMPVSVEPMPLIRIAHRQYTTPAFVPSPEPEHGGCPVEHH